MDYVIQTGVATYTATATALCITSSNANLVGILWQGTASGAVQIWSGVTATSTALATALSGTIRFSGPQFYPFPGVAKGGITILSSVASDPSLTLFWLPA